MGDATVPHTPSRHKGAKLRFLPFGNPSLGERSGLRPSPFGNPSLEKGAGLGPRLWKPPPKDRDRQRKEKQEVPYLQPGKCHARRCGDVLRGHLRILSAAGRKLSNFAGSAYRPLLRMGELAHEGPTHPQASFLLTMNGRFLFGKTKRKWGFNFVPHSGIFPVSPYKGIFPTAMPCHPAPYGSALLSPKKIPPHILRLR